jgi:hypothetical protein
LRWNGIVETPGFWAFPAVNLAEDFDPTRVRILEKPEPGPAFEAARSTPAFQAFLGFSQYTLWRLLPSAQIENGKRVEAYDLRFGSPASPAFFAHALLDGNLKAIESSFHFR